MDRLRHEFEAIGFYLSAHPLETYGRALAHLGVVPSGHLARAVAREPGRKTMAGIVIGKQERTSRQGNRFAFAQLSDPSGVYEVTLFSEVLMRSRELLEAGTPLLLTVDVRQDGDELRLNAQDIHPLDAAVAHSAAGLRLYMRDAATLHSLQSLLDRETGEGNGANGGKARISLVLETADGDEVEVELPSNYRLSGEMRQAIKAIPGLVVEDL
jgi:DNA polymerase-3 subunit alpha